MNVLALNGSPRIAASSTFHILDPLLEGMREAGAATKLIHVRRLRLEPCIGCFGCWIHTPGRCIHEDGMAEAIRAYNDADLVIFGTPLYHGSMSGLLKTFLDRLLPRYEPWLIPHPSVEGMTGHPRRWAGPKRMVLVSGCGFPEIENFDALVHTFRHIARLNGLEIVAEILRPYAEPLSRPELQDLLAPYYLRVREAGTELVVRGGIGEELRDELAADLFPGGKARMYELANDHWTSQLERRGAASMETSAGEQAGSCRTGEPTLGTLVEGMCQAFDPHAARDLEATIGFQDATGSDDCSLTMASGRCRFTPGPSVHPDLAIRTSASTWLAISRGELDGATALMEGRYAAEGDIALLVRLGSIFRRDS